MSIGMQAHRRGLLFDGSDRGITLSTSGTDHLIAAGNFCHASFLIEAVGLGTGTETVSFSECSNNNAGWMSGYANNAGSGKLWWGCRARTGWGFAFSTDWTATAGRYEIEFEYAYGGANFTEAIWNTLASHDYSITINGVIQDIDNTEIDVVDPDTDPTTAIAVGPHAMVLVDTASANALANQFGSAIRGSTAYSTATGGNLMPNRWKLLGFRCERQVAGVADCECWFDSMTTVGTDQVGNYDTMSFNGSGATLPRNVVTRLGSAPQGIGHGGPGIIRGISRIELGGAA